MSNYRIAEKAIYSKVIAIVFQITVISFNLKWSYLLVNIYIFCCYLLLFIALLCYCHDKEYFVVVYFLFYIRPTVLLCFMYNIPVR